MVTFTETIAQFTMASIEHPFGKRLKSFAEWMLSAAAISVIERLASKHARFYERLLATLDIRVQEYIATCADAANEDEIESSLLNFGTLRQNLRLQNISDLVGPVFPETKSPQAKRNIEDAGSPATKIRVMTNANPHPSLALASYAEWEKVRRFTQFIPKVGSVEVCGRFHCRQVCSSKYEQIHGRLQPSTVAETEVWISESKAKTAKGGRGPEA